MRSVVVTGASTGIGRATTAALVAARFHVWATVRRPDDAASLRLDHGDAVSPLLVDITDDDAVRAAGDEVHAAGPLYALVNNAGAALPGPLEHLPLDVLRRQLEVNLVAQLGVTQAMLPALRASRDAGKDARIVMIGSIGGRVAGPVLGAYSAAKFGVVGLTGSLRAELAPSGIRVLLVEPGAIATPIWSRGAAAGQLVADAMPPEGLARYRGQIDHALANARRSAVRGAPPERVADVVVRALLDRHPAPRRVVGRDARVAAAMVRLLPHRAVYALTAARR
ncbi:SDR family NAD(P)-dependent oxidoreductase [Cellulomonas sp. H30R-01]|uniref:SDR family NAD(P)-dependent oxidoreductase n=1 Tax=Cellulomonas sp. H30R-01 TaxID=2704467 RepID=UPI00138D1E66|nr:SDR family NAD(P)-dependent oxidoreductase [Cellulomonas sp. H30R-01]QHT55746.1 SDR family NAD(P)-dependent oxidoreductase [Cellulomonas sp. H30R-01]